MNGIQTWGEAITVSLMGLWERFILFIPALIGAIIVFVVGWIVASILGRLVEKLIKSIKVDQALEKVLFHYGGIFQIINVKIQLKVNC